ncbi:hypothetical protein F5888DRAFT_1946660 [Russula emetica]|nr:hypothetical protein F5888DRAFT_1946660 [Russula emetica]
MPSSIKPSAAFYLALVLAAGQRALAVNDWSVPCTQGTCSWDLPAESGSSGSVNIWGPVSAISDITPATGWQIMTECDPTSSKQDIQLMCKDNNPDCNHLFQGNGAVNTIVRLSESCGPMPFARVAQYQVFTRGNGSEAAVHQLTLDTDFAAAGPSHGDEVHFSVQGQNWRDNSNAVNRRQADGNSTNDGNSTTEHVQGSAPVNYTGQNNLFSNGSSSMDVYTNLQASVGISAVIAGTIVPPNVTQFGITFILDGNADVKFNVLGNISGSISSGNTTLYQTLLPISSLVIPEILEVGPEFTLLGRIDTNFGLTNVNATVEVNHDFGNSSFVFPPQNGSNSNTDHIASSSNQIIFSANQEVGATLGASAHLIPQVGLGISALGGSANASVYMDFDASLGLQGSIASAANSQPCLAGNANINVSVGAQGSFFGLFDRYNEEKSLFDKNFSLFHHCFAANSNSMNFTNQSSSAQPAPGNATDSALQTTPSRILSLMFACTLAILFD